MAENTIPSTTPPVDDPKTLFSSIIPEEFKNEGYFKDLGPMELEAGRAEFFKKFHNAQGLLGKKTGVPASDASDEEWDKFTGQLRPESGDAYAIGDKVDPEFAKTLRTAFLESDMTPRQAAKFQEKVLAPIMEKQASEAEERKKLDDAFEELTTKTFGADNEKVLARVNATLKELTPEALRPHIDKLSNENMVIVAGVIDAVLNKYGVEDGGLNGGDPLVGDPTGTPSALREEGMKLMQSEPYTNLMHPDHEATAKKVNEMFELAGKREQT